MSCAYGNLIGGSWRGAPAGFDTFSPARPAQVVGRYSLADASLVAEAVAAAKQAQQPWARQGVTFTGSVAIDGCEAGHFYAPTVLDGVRAACFSNDTTEHAVYRGT